MEPHESLLLLISLHRARQSCQLLVVKKCLVVTPKNNVPWKITGFGNCIMTHESIERNQMCQEHLDIPSHIAIRSPMTVDRRCAIRTTEQLPWTECTRSSKAFWTFPSFSASLEGWFYVHVCSTNSLAQKLPPRFKCRGGLTNRWGTSEHRCWKTVSLGESPLTKVCLAL